MGLGTGWANANSDMAGQLRQRIIDQLAQQQTQLNMQLQARGADRADRQQGLMEQEHAAALAESARVHDLNAANQTEDNNRALNEQIPAGTAFPTADPNAMKLVGRLRTVGGVGGAPEEAHLPSTQTEGGMTMPSASGATGTIRGSLVSMNQEGNPEQYRKLASSKQQTAQEAADAKVEAARQAAEDKAAAASTAADNRKHEDAQRQQDRLAQIAASAAARPVKPEKPNTINLSQGGKSAKAAIEQAAPLTDRVMEMIRQEAPDIESNPQKYNGVMAKGHSILQTMKYKAGFADDTDPRQQLVSLLQPIQAGQYTRSSRSRQMLELALKHMADPSQTLLTQYQRAKELKAIMPEMLEGIVRAETPVDPSNPLGGSYLDPHKGGGAAPAAGGGTVEKWGRDASGRLVKQ